MSSLRCSSKHLYARARLGELANFTGIDSDYQPPQTPELHVETTRTSPEEAADLILDDLRRRGRLGRQ